MPVTEFTARWPILFHVTETGSIPSIRCHGLMSAAALCRRHVPTAEADTLLQNNRDSHATPASGLWLRRQGLRDAALRPRLDPGITCMAWRLFINSLVFFCPSQAAAHRLHAAETSRRQSVLAFRTQDVLAAAPDLRWCAYNNGFIDRAPRATARRRKFDDYRPLSAWHGEPVRELAASEALPPGLAFEILSVP